MFRRIRSKLCATVGKICEPYTSLVRASWTIFLNVGFAYRGLLCSLAGVRGTSRPVEVCGRLGLCKPSDFGRSDRALWLAMAVPRNPKLSPFVSSSWSSGMMLLFILSCRTQNFRQYGHNLLVEQQVDVVGEMLEIVLALQSHLLPVALMKQDTANK